MTMITTKAKPSVGRIAEEMVLALRPNTSAVDAAQAAAVACGMLLGASGGTVRDELIIETVRDAEAATRAVMHPIPLPPPVPLLDERFDDEIPF